MKRLENATDIFEKILDGEKIFKCDNEKLSQYDIYKYDKRYFLVWWFDKRHNQSFRSIIQ